MKKRGNGIKRGGGGSGRRQGLWIGEGRKGKTVVRGRRRNGKRMVGGQGNVLWEGEGRRGGRRGVKGCREKEERGIIDIYAI